MILTVNLGNTHITIGGYEHDDLIFCGRLHTDPAATVDEYALRMVNLLSLHRAAPEQIEGGILGSVVPALTGRVLAALQMLCPVRILTVGPGLKSGIRLRLDNPAQVGAELLCANLQPRCEVLGEIPEQLDFFDVMPEYDVSLYTNKKQKTTPESAKEALEALLPVLSDEALDFGDRDTVFDACKAKAEELGKKNGWLLYPLGIALSGKQRTPGGGTDLACMMGREKTLERVKAAIGKLNG